jgi:Rrf2 family protein
MLFSQTAEYALRAMAHLSTQPEFASTMPEMAEATRVPVPYLRKVLSRLRAANIIATQRGVGGGVRLCTRPEDLTILSILNAVDPIKRIERCPLGLPEHFALCPLHSEVNEAIAQVTNVLSRKTLADLLMKKRLKTVQCNFPKSADKDVYHLG